MNDLVDVSAGDVLHNPDPGDGRDLYPIIGPIMDTADSFGSGNWAGGLLGLANTALDVAQMILDPIGELLSSVASFLISYMPPLPQIMNVLVGNPEMVANIGSTWGNVEGRLQETATELTGYLQECLASWSGDGADSFRRAVERRIEALGALAMVSGSMSLGFVIASAIVEAIRVIVTDLIADLVAKLISYVAQAFATFGVGLSWVIPSATLAIADWTTTITSFTESLIDAITSGTGLIEALVDGIGEIQTLLNAVAGGVERATA